MMHIPSMSSFTNEPRAHHDSAHHDSAHHGGAHHAHGRRASRRRLTATLVLVVGYLLAEVVGGYWTHSLALLADAGHMASDAAALGLAIFALWLADRPATARRSYGFYRAEILAALANGASLIAISGIILYEAWSRLRAPPAVQGLAMMGIATGGLVVNLAGLWLLRDGRADGVNERGAWLHVMTDALGSVGAMTSGALVWAFGWQWADPIASALIGLLVVFSSWQLLRETVSVLMESAPAGIDVDALRRSLLAVPGVLDVHDLHVWSITSGQVSLSAHVRVSDGASGNAMLEALRRCVHGACGIDHATFQLETPGLDEAGTHD